MDELNNVPIFALEGSAFAGKTTLLNYVKENFGDKINVIPEVGEYVGGDKNFPNVPFKNIEEAKFSTYFFVEIEKRRYKDIIDLYRANKRPVLIDRFTFLSSLVFYKLLQKSGLQSKEMYGEFSDHAKSVFAKSIADSSICPPNAFILIKHLNEEVFNSRLSRGTKNSVFTNWENCKYVNRQYDLCFKGVSEESVKTLHSSNSNLEQNTTHIINFIERNKNLPKVILPFSKSSPILTPSLDIDKDIVLRAKLRANYLMDKAKLNLNQYGGTL